MTQKDRDRLVALKKARKGLITQREAAAEIGQSERHVRRLLVKLKKEGDRAVVHKLRGRLSNRRAARQDGLGFGCIPECLLHLLHSSSHEEAVVSSVRSGGDTDTNAAITGALLGSVYGRDGIPQQWRTRIQSCRPISGLPGVKRPRPALYWPVDVLSLAENLLVAGRVCE